jgi:hypothetical protein
MCINGIVNPANSVSKLTRATRAIFTGAIKTEVGGADEK